MEFPNTLFGLPVVIRDLPLIGEIVLGPLEDYVVGILRSPCGCCIKVTGAGTPLGDYEPCEDHADVRTRDAVALQFADAMRRLRENPMTSDRLLP